MPRSSFAIAMKDYTFIRPGIAVSISAATLIVALIIGALLIRSLAHSAAVVEQGGETVRTLHSYSAALEVWRMMAVGGDPGLQRPEARALRDSIRAALTAQLKELRASMTDENDRDLVGRVLDGLASREVGLGAEERQAMIVLVSHQDAAMFEAAAASQRAVTFAAVLLALTVLAAGMLVIPMAWLYIRYKRGATIEVKV